MKRGGSLLLLAAAVVASCHGSGPGDLPCAPPGVAYSWPVDPTALTPAAWPANQPFTQAPHATFPAITGTAAGVLPSLRLVSVVAAGDPLHDALFAFGDALVASQWLQSFAPEYGAAATATSVHLDGPAAPGAMTFDDMVGYIHALEPSPPEPTVYVLYLPPGTNVAFKTEVNCGCNAITGAHAGDGAGNAVAYVQRCSPSDDDSVTRTASHEVAESITDAGDGGYFLPQGNPPWTGSPWASVEGGGVEIGDLCNSSFVTEGPWTYQRIWSNLAAAAGGDPCVPALPTPYFNVTTDATWVSLSPGESVDVPLTGWSTGARSDWYVYALPTSPTTPFTAAVTTARQQPLDAVVYDAINDGVAGTLTITASPTATSGDDALVRIVSRSADRTDGAHFWPVGVHVP
jgi:hypothetical protein